MAAPVSWRDVSLRFHPAYQIARVDPLYLSLSIDISVLADGFWWEGSQAIKRGLGVTRIPTLDFKQAELDRYVAMATPRPCC